MIHRDRLSRRRALSLVKVRIHNTSGRPSKTIMASSSSKLFEGELNEIISRKRETVVSISDELWKDPEPSLRESQAHDLLTAFLQSEGFSVEKQFVTPTGFRATFASSADSVDASGDSRIPNACFMCEYDAVGEVGHAAGHNLKTEGSLIAALAVKDMIEKGTCKGKVSFNYLIIAPSNPIGLSILRDIESNKCCTKIAGWDYFSKVATVIYVFCFIKCS